MKVKISISLPRELLRTVDQRAKEERTTRTDFIEAAVQAFTARPIRDEQNARDLEIINRHADFLNQQARETLEYLPR